VIGRPFSEGALLGMIHAYQRETAWHRKRPIIKPLAAA
jgi:Asp-tRNA(Asn)/Glu-tRNA(Gln) amidotransferase A subunit family amidase